MAGMNQLCYGPDGLCVVPKTLVKLITVVQGFCTCSRVKRFQYAVGSAHLSQVQIEVELVEHISIFETGGKAHGVVATKRLLFASITFSVRFAVLKVSVRPPLPPPNHLA